MKKALLVCLTAALAIAPMLSGQTPERKVAIFVANRGPADQNDQARVFEDMITAQVTDLGFSIISREMVLNAVGDLLAVQQQNELDSILDDQTSALRLSQNLGADYLLFASMNGIDKETRDVNAYGVSYQNQTYTLRTTYRILNGNTGASMTAGAVDPTRSVQQTEHSRTTTSGLIRELLGKASKGIAAQLKQKDSVNQLEVVSVEDAKVTFQVVVSLSDVNFPEVVIDEDGKPRVTANQATVQPLAVPVEIDGFTVGTTGTGETLTSLQASPGLHRIRLARGDLEPFERMVNIHEGMQLNVAMQLNAQGRQRWEENTAILNNLKKDAILTDAQAEALRGLAQMLRQSGYKVDSKSDIKVDTDEGIDIERNQSLMQQN